jgi:predicted ester cyclase
MDIKEFGEKYIKAQEEAWREGKFDGLEEILTPDVIYHFGALGDMQGLEGHKQYVLASMQNYSDTEYNWQYLVGDGNLFAISYKSKGTATTDIPALNITKGNKHTGDYIFIIQVKDNKVSEVWANGSYNISD